jgi:hypothetical protein
MVPITHSHDVVSPQKAKAELNTFSAGNGVYLNAKAFNN